jgi:hypothetical protein
VTAEEMAEAIEDLLRAITEDEDGDPTELHGARVRSYRRDGTSTQGAGFVVELNDGSEYRVTVTQSRAVRNDDENMP